MFCQLSKPTTKSSQSMIEERIQIMADRLESLRQSDFFTRKSNIFQMELQKNRENHIKSVNRIQGLRKSQIIQRPSKCLEIDEFLSKYKKNPEISGTGKGLLGLKQPKMIKSQFIGISDDQNGDKSYQGRINAQRSDSEMKYFQMCSMPESYVQQFLEILQDQDDRNPERNYECFNRSKQSTRKTATSQQQSQKYLQRIQQQQVQENSGANRKSWRQRCREAITKSRRVLDKSRLSPKFLQFQRDS